MITGKSDGTPAVTDVPSCDYRFDRTGVAAAA